MVRTCDVCQISYEAKRSTSKFCSPKCRKRSFNAPSVTLAPVTSLVLASVAPSSSSLYEAALRELVAVGQENSSLGFTALILARRLDEGVLDTGSSVAALVREYRATLEVALAGGKVANDPVDEIADQRRARLARA